MTPLQQPCTWIDAEASECLLVTRSFQCALHPASRPCIFTSIAGSLTGKSWRDFPAECRQQGSRQQDPEVCRILMVWNVMMACTHTGTEVRFAATSTLPNVSGSRQAGSLLLPLQMHLRPVLQPLQTAPPHLEARLPLLMGPAQAQMLRLRSDHHQPLSPFWGNVW